MAKAKRVDKVRWQDGQMEARDQNTKKWIKIPINVFFALIRLFWYRDEINN